MKDTDYAEKSIKKGIKTFRDENAKLSTNGRDKISFKDLPWYINIPCAAFWIYLFVALLGFITTLFN